MNRKNKNILLFFQSLPQWTDIHFIVQKFHKEGYKAWLVGGCVRDALCHIIPKDIDFATDALPDVVENLFPKTLSIGKRFGTVVIPLNGYNYEVTTFRSDGVYKDNRHPENITFGTPHKDAQRRDFTCNALFFDMIHHQLVDFVGGALDIQEKRIRCVGLPEKRFAEDALRLLRTIRFSAQLNWEVDPNTLHAVVTQRHLITSISIERIKEEFFKIIMSDHHQRGFRLLENTKLFQAFLGPEFSALSLPHIPLFGSLDARLVAFTDQWPLEYVERFFKKIHFSKKHIQYLLYLSSQIKQNIQQWPLSDIRQLVTSPYFEDISSLLKTFDKQDVLDQLISVKKTYPVLPAPLLSGSDFLDLGYSPGKALGDLLRDIREAQLNEQITTREQALAFIKEKMKLDKTKA